MREFFRDTLIVGSLFTMAAVGVRTANESTNQTRDFQEQNFQAVLPEQEATKIGDWKLVSIVPKKIK